MSFKVKYLLELKFTYYLLGKGVSIGIGLISLPLIIKLFGIEVFGRFSVLNTTFLMFLSGGMGWIIQGILRFSTLEPDKGKFLNGIIKIALLVSVLTGVLLSLGFYVYGSGSWESFIVFFAFIFAGQFTVLSTFHQVDYKSTSLILADIIRQSVFLVGIITGNYLFSASLSSLVILFGALTCSYLFASLYLMVYSPGISLSKSAGPDKNSVKKWWVYGYPLTIWMFLSPSINTFDRYVIDYYNGVAVVGLYVAVFDVFFKLFSQLTNPFFGIAHPMLINSFNEGRIDEFSRVFKRSAGYLTIMFAGLAVMVYFLKLLILKNYLKFSEEQIVMAEKIIWPLMISSFFWQLAVLVQKLFEVNNQTLKMAFFMLISVVVMFIANTIFVPSLGWHFTSYSLLFGSIFYIFLLLINLRSLNMSLKK